jgi:hypothetical protein
VRHVSFMIHWICMLPWGKSHELRQESLLQDTCLIMILQNCVSYDSLIQVYSLHCFITIYSNPERLESSKTRPIVVWDHVGRNESSWDEQDIGSCFSSNRKTSSYMQMVYTVKQSPKKKIVEAYKARLVARDIVKPMG